MTANRGGLIVILSGCCAESGVGAESVTFTVKGDVPVAVRVPEITPELLSDKFAGGDPVATLQVSVPVPPLA
jgi:hypothetical protein